MRSQSELQHDIGDGEHRLVVDRNQRKRMGAPDSLAYLLKNKL
ncbi:MAG TPA: hypothetical protein VF898_02025 [Chloroflexota bacterium]